MPRLQAYALWLKSQESEPLPPAPAAALKVVEKPLTLADRYNAQRQDRIFTGRNVPIGMTA